MEQRLSQFLCLAVEPSHACPLRGRGQWQCPHSQLKAGAGGPDANTGIASGAGLAAAVMEHAAEEETVFSPGIDSSFTLLGNKQLAPVIGKPFEGTLFRN